MKIAILILAIVLLLPLIIGLLLPSERKFIKTAQLSSSPEEIWAVITDVKGQEDWRSDVKSIQMLESEKGAEQWTEIPRSGSPITFRVKTYEPPYRYDIEIIEHSFSGYWEGRLKAGNGSTAVEFKEVAIIKNPYFRVLSYLFFDLNKTMDLYISNLKRKLGES